MTIRPMRLPHVRDQMQRFLTRSDSPLRQTVPEHAEDFDLTAQHLTTAELYWVTSDMAALATSAGRALDTVCWAEDARPAPAGLIVMDGGIGWWSRTADEEYPVDALSWGTGPDGQLHLALWVGRYRMDANLAAQGTQVDPDQVPPLVPMSSHTLPAHADEQPVADLDGDLRTLAATLAAAWHLMGQPTLADTRDEPVDRRTRRKYARLDRGDPSVTLIDLRSTYRPSEDGADEAGTSRHHRHRWVVRGHWRNQAHGAGQQQRKKIWVTDYVKGPDGAPLLDHERVNVWRR